MSHRWPAAHPWMFSQQPSRGQQIGRTLLAPGSFHSGGRLDGLTGERFSPSAMVRGEVWYDLTPLRTLPPLFQAGCVQARSSTGGMRRGRVTRVCFATLPRISRSCRRFSRHRPAFQVRRRGRPQAG